MALGAAVPPRVVWGGRRGEGGDHEDQDDPVDDDVPDHDQDQDDADDDQVLGQHENFEGGLVLCFNEM